MFNYRAGAPDTNDRVLAREVKATVIPAGDIVAIPAGTKVNVTHRLGGNFTVVCDYGMFRINGADAEALGEEVPKETAAAGGSTDEKGSRGVAEHPDHQGPPDQDAIWRSLKTVFDPEIPVNIVDLGLVYSLKVAPLADDDNDRHKVDIAMTLTAPGCGMGPSIAEDAQSRARRPRRQPGRCHHRLGPALDAGHDFRRRQDGAGSHLNLVTNDACGTSNNARRFAF